MAGKALGGMGIAFLIAHFTECNALRWGVICLIASLVVSLPSARRADRIQQRREDVQS